MLKKSLWQQRYNGQPGAEPTGISMVAKNIVARYAPKKKRYLLPKYLAVATSFFRESERLDQSKQYRKHLQPQGFLMHCAV